MNETNLNASVAGVPRNAVFQGRLSQQITREQAEKFKHLPVLEVPDDLWDRPIPEQLKAENRNIGVSDGDREMMSAVIGVYAFVPGLAEQIRYISFLISKTRGLLLKKGRAREHRPLLTNCRAHWGLAVNMSNNDQEWDFVLMMLGDIEDALQMVIEKEGLSANARETYRGEILLPGPIQQPSGEKV